MSSSRKRAINSEDAIQQILDFVEQSDDDMDDEPDLIDLYGADEIYRYTKISWIFDQMLGIYIPK